MALFIVTGFVSLTAGLGIGALIESKPSPSLLHSKKQRRTPHVKVGTTHQRQRIPSPVPVKKSLPLPNNKLLDFTDFDKSLMKMVKEKEPVKPINSMKTTTTPMYSKPHTIPTVNPTVHPKVNPNNVNPTFQEYMQSTLRNSVVDNSQFYSPPSAVAIQPQLQGGERVQGGVQGGVQGVQPRQLIVKPGNVHKKFETSWF